MYVYNTQGDTMIDNAHMALRCAALRRAFSCLVLRVARRGVNAALDRPCSVA